MIKTKNREVGALLQLLRCALKGEEFKCEGELDFDKLLELANSQQVYTTVLPVLEKAELLSKEQREKWNNYRLSELKKTITVNSERAAIFSELDELGIRYMPLKGLIIREYYPQSTMRQMSDNDILYDEINRDALCRIMKKRGYYIGASGGISDDFYKKPYCTFEFHRTLFNPEEEFCPEFDAWENAEKAQDSFCYNMSREDNFLYALGHMYKHYACVSGCGIRFVCDIYLLSKDEGLDLGYIRKRLEEFGICDFSDTVSELAAAVFEDAEPSERALGLLEFMFSGGVFGTDRTAEKSIEKYGTKAGFLLHRIFPPMRDMKREYRALNKKPYLAPFYYIFRLIDKFIHNRKYMKRDLDALKNKKK